MVMNGGINPAVPGYSPKPQQLSPLSPYMPVPSAPVTSSFLNPALPASSDSLTLSTQAPSQTAAPALNQPVPAKPAATTLSLPNVSASLPSGLPAGPVAFAPATAEGLKPLSSPQLTGKQVGDLVTKLLVEVPALQEKIEHIDWEALSKEDLQPKLEKFRATVQQHIKHIPKIIDRKLINLFDDPKNKTLGTQFMAWLRKEPDPQTLAELQKPKVRAEEAGVDDFDEAEAPARRHSLDNSEEGLEEGMTDEPPKSLLGKVRARVQDGYAQLEERFLPAKPNAKAHAKGGKTGRSGGDEMNDADLQELLGSLRSGGPNSSASLGDRGPRHGDSPL